MIATIRTDADTNETSIYPITQPALLRKLSRIADWQRYDQRSEDWATTDPTAKYVTVLYDAGDYPHLPTLRGIARQPHLRIDGSLVKLAGYDRETGLFGVFDARLYNGINIIQAKAGNDVLFGYGGNDILLGSTGDDTYVFDRSLVTGQDLINDSRTDGVVELNMFNSTIYLLTKLA